MNKNQVKGRVKVMKGTAMAVAGKLLHKPTLTAKARLQKAAGTVQAAYGDASSAAGKRAKGAARKLAKKGKAVKKAVAARKPK